ncbi:2321_t:CDS:2, partial [Dentiscutata erythropus]
TYAIKKPEIPDPVPVHEVLPLPVVITQDSVNKRKYIVESKWYGTLDPNEEVYAKFKCRNGAKANKSNVKKIFSDFKETFEVIVPNKTQIITCRRGIFDIDSFKFRFKFEHKE